MLRKLPVFLTRLFDRSSLGSTRLPATIIPRDQHEISRKQISRAALDVLYGLHKGGYDAYLVGGCLRDLLTGLEPKDFDVVTNAHPEEIQALFRRSRIIGRRFRLVHVRFGRDVIEVATFRALHQNNGETFEADDRSMGDSGLILRDNVYGTIEEDSLRRDFTINALYYNIADFTLHDFTGSLKDIEQKIIRLIGDPEKRYREDPVRMIRALRFAAKLEFDLEPATEKPIRSLANQLTHVAPARLFDEIIKLFLNQHAQRSLALMEEHQLLPVLFPDIALAMKQPDNTDRAFLQAAMLNTERRIAQDKPLTPAFLYAVLLWPSLRQQMKENHEQGMTLAQARHKAQGEVLVRQVQRIAIPRRFTTMMREIWDLQPRLERRHADRLDQLASHPRFRAAYDFLLLREEAGEPTHAAASWWTRYQELDDAGRQQLIRELHGSHGKRRRRRRRKQGESSS